MQLRIARERPLEKNDRVAGTPVLHVKCAEPVQRIRELGIDGEGLAISGLRSPDVPCRSTCVAQVRRVRRVCRIQPRCALERLGGIIVTAGVRMQ